MRAVDIIAKKRDGEALSEQELQWLMAGFLDGTVPDYQMSAWLMAVYLRGMTDQETVALTKAMLQSGEQVDLSQFSAPTVDKHSTGGVGDKISLILGPLLAAAGLVVGKLTGRGLGHTGGTVDKLESIPGFSTELSREQYFAELKRVGLSMISAGPSLAPADKRIYALRDVTATVGCLPLIASSIMSKKLAGGARHIVLDVKYGAGAFLPDLESARELARLMIAIGRSCDRQVRAVISDMNQPLGLAVGNSLEVKEAISVLHQQGPSDVRSLVLTLGSEVMQSATGLPLSVAKEQLTELLDSGAAWEKFRQFVTAQGGDVTYIQQPDRLPTAAHVLPLPAPTSGYVQELNALQIGQAAMLLGAGRARKEDLIDHAAGIYLHKKRGARVEKDEPLAWLHGADSARLQSVAEIVVAAWSIGPEQPTERPLIADVLR
jgi:pyrimidine-nucleoside phosphorylase